MKKILLLLSALLIAIPGFSQEIKNIYHWTGSSEEGMSIDLTVAVRSDGLVAGTFVTETNGVSAEYTAFGFELKDYPNNLLLDIYSGSDFSYSLPGEITASGDYDCWVVPNLDDGTKAVLKKAPAPKNFENPFKHATYKEMKKVSEFYRARQDSAEDMSINSLITMSDEEGKIIFTINADGADYKYGDLYVGDDDMNSQAQWLDYKDGVVDFTVNKLSIRLEFFKDFVYVKRTCEFDARDDMNMDFEKAAGYYYLQSHIDGLPAWWYEEEGDTYEYEPKFTEVGELLASMTCCGSDYWMREGAIKVDYAGTRPNIEDYFKAFHKKYQGEVVNKTSDIIYGVTPASGKNSATLDKRHGFLKSDIEGNYYEGMQMCYWKTPTDHDIVALRINYTGLGEFDAFNSTLLILYEFDTEKHMLRPMSVGGYHSWAISDAYLLPDSLTAFSNIQLPQEGKDIIYYEDYGPGAKKHTLRWNGEWFDY